MCVGAYRRVVLTLCYTVRWLAAATLKGGMTPLLWEFNLRRYFGATIDVAVVELYYEDIPIGPICLYTWLCFIHFNCICVKYFSGQRWVYFCSDMEAGKMCGITELLSDIWLSSHSCQGFTIIMATCWPLITNLRNYVHIQITCNCHAVLNFFF